MTTMTRRQVEDVVRADYDAVAGRVVLLRAVDAICDRGRRTTVRLSPPAVARIRCYDASEVASKVTRWTPDGWCDPVHEVEMLEPHEALEDLMPIEARGVSRNVDGRVDCRHRDYAVAGDALQAEHADAEPLPREVGGAGPSRGAAPSPR